MLKMSISQRIAVVVIAVITVLFVGTGVYGLSVRNGAAGVSVIRDLRLQSILNTAGAGSVEAYVAAAKAEATARVRAEGGGMSEIREASALAEEEARASFHFEPVDLSTVDTAGLEVAVNDLVAAQRDYYEAESAAQALYIEEHEEEFRAAAAAQVAADSEEEVEVVDMIIDLSGFVATEEMVALQAVVDERFVTLKASLMTIFPDLTDDVLDTLKPTLLALTYASGDTFETQYDRYVAAAGTAHQGGFQYFVMRNGGNLLTISVGLFILTLLVLFYQTLVRKLGLPRLIIGMFFVLLCLLAVLYGLSLPSLLGNTIVRLGMNSVLVLAMLPGIQCGISLNLGLPLGIIGGLLGGLLCIEWGFSGWPGFLFAIAVGLVISSILGYLYALLLNRLKGNEMAVTTYVGYSIVSLMCIGWLILPFQSPELKWPLGDGLRVTLGLQSSYRHLLNDFLSFELFGITIPTGLLLFMALCCLLMWLFMRSKTGIAMSAVGNNPRFAEATGINVDKMRIIGTTLSTMLGAVGIIVYSQSYGFMQLYQAPRQLGFVAASAILIGGASTSRARISHVIIGTFLFQGVLTLGMPVANVLVPQSTISETLRILISNGIILYALTKSGGASRA